MQCKHPGFPTLVSPALHSDHRIDGRPPNIEQGEAKSECNRRHISNSPSASHRKWLYYNRRLVYIYIYIYIYIYRIASKLLELGAACEEETWDRLLLFAVREDLVNYPRHAHERGVYLHNVDEANKFSLHKCVAYYIYRIYVA